MESHEILKKAVDRVGAKKVAAALSVSTSLVYKWCERRGDPDETSGARNPLDRIKLLMDATGDIDVAQWICRQASGFFCSNPDKSGMPLDTDYLDYTQKMLSDFSDLLRVMSDSINNDGRIDNEEASRIRKEWEDLKRYGEQFVTGCEDGRFDKV